MSDGDRHRGRPPPEAPAAIYPYALALADVIRLENLPNAGQRTWDLCWTDAVASDLKRTPGASLWPPVISNRRMSTKRSAASTSSWGTPARRDCGNSSSADVQSFTALVDRLERGQVRTLLVLGGNPIYSAPADLDLAGLVKKVKTSIHIGMYRDEMAEVCHGTFPRHTAG